MDGRRELEGWKGEAVLGNHAFADTSSRRERPCGDPVGARTRRNKARECSLSTLTGHTADY